MPNRKSILVVGIGNPYRCDDGVGLTIAFQLDQRFHKRLDVCSKVKDGFFLIHIWQKYDCVYLIDAVSPDCTPGLIYRFDPLAIPLAQNFFTKYSTHSINIPKTIDLARNLGMLPQKLIVYGVEGKDFSIGKGLSKEVRQAVSRVVDCIASEIEKCFYFD